MILKEVSDLSFKSKAFILLVLFVFCYMFVLTSLVAFQRPTIINYSWSEPYFAQCDYSHPCFMECLMDDFNFYFLMCPAWVTGKDFNYMGGVNEP